MLLQRIGVLLIIAISIIATCVALFTAPIAQDLDYHFFKDARQILTIPNFFNVFSNLPFLIVGLIGIKKLLQNKLIIIEEFKQAYFIFLLGVALVALGSSYYHYWPNNQTLVWDRLPMTIAFMSLTSIIVGEFISLRLAKVILWPLLLIGIFSVFYWQLTEKSGQGDLRLYGLVQFLPMIIMPIILICFKSKFSHVSMYWWLSFFYLLSKVFEYCDSQVYSMLGFISGHSIKHLAAALGLWVMLMYYEERTVTVKSEQEQKLG